MISVFFLFSLVSCQEGEKGKVQRVGGNGESDLEPVSVPDFNADSAFHFIEKQVGFGPRVPNTKSHEQCGDYLINKLEAYGAEMVVQKAKVKAYNGKKLRIRNIMGQFDPVKAKRVMLYAHWDTRPMADRGKEKTDEPIQGANDGGSGTAVLLEIARHLNQTSPNIGVDIVLFDGEDYGQPEGTKKKDHQNDTWCLGSQYWSRNIPVPNYSPQYGILLDMVGSEDAIFPKEGLSIRYAPDVVRMVWNTAGKLGYSNYFIDDRIGPITDDHLYVNRIARIPSVNIVHYDPERKDFGIFHHTHQDNLDLIHKPTLKAVGETVLEVIYRE